MDGKLAIHLTKARHKIIIEEDLSPDPSLLGYPLLSSLTLIELYLFISLFFSISYELI